MASGGNVGCASVVRIGRAEAEMLRVEGSESASTLEGNEAQEEEGVRHRQREARATDPMAEQSPEVEGRCFIPFRACSTG
jgi:hypothetical protein